MIVTYTLLVSLFLFFENALHMLIRLAGSLLTSIPIVNFLRRLQQSQVRNGVRVMFEWFVSERTCQLKILVICETFYKLFFKTCILLVQGDASRSDSKQEESISIDPFKHLGVLEAEISIRCLWELLISEETFDQLINRVEKACFVFLI